MIGDWLGLEQLHKVRKKDTTTTLIPKTRIMNVPTRGQELRDLNGMESGWMDGWMGVKLSFIPCCPHAVEGPL